MQLSNRHWSIIIFSSFVVYILLTMLFIFWGGVNADEGWYLYASQLVYEGQLPYRDFAFTQLPLLPYVYGAVQLGIGHSLYAGRFLTALLGFSAMWFAVRVAKDAAGVAAAALTGLLWATFTYGIYFHAITKTYALTTLFFMIAIFFLTRKRNEWYLVAAAGFSLLAVLTRLSGLFFALPVLFYAYLSLSVKVKWILLGCAMAAVGWVAWLVYPNVDSFLWNVLIHHTALKRVVLQAFF